MHRVPDAVSMFFFVMPGQKRVFALDVPGIHVLLTLLS